ncbi:tyrosinase family oxidase copper chaperone [Streptomyces sp. NPDC047928]|uniref:tyrosinase family oxidase copper chaperone n=1 Tax=unclassified Streptomyces TaxID=2593676 RepID=UPI003720BA79
MSAKRPPSPAARRRVLRTLFTLTVAAFTGGTLARISATPRDRARPGPEGTAAGSGAAPGAVTGSWAVAGGFDEMYRGRRIQGRPAPSYTGGFDVLVDGRPLHLMRCADGGYLSVVDHYRSYPTPLAATRGAVDELGSARLARTPAHGARPRDRGDHGLHT